MSQLIERLAKLQTFGSFLKGKEKSNNWKYCEGYTIGNKKHYADFIQNKVSINPTHFKEDGIIKTSIETEGYFEAPRKKSKEIYLEPHILIKENIGQNSIPIDLLNYDAVFSHEIIGIHAPDKDYDVLKMVYNSFVLNNSLYRFYILATSSRVLIGRATAILKRDIDNLPISRDIGVISVSAAEELIIQDVMSYQRKDKQDALSVITDINDISIFSEIFCKTLNSIYKKEKSFQLFKIIDAGKYFALHFEYSSEKLHTELENADDLERYIESVIPSRKENKESTHIQKIIKVYGQDTIILAKPKQLRYWLPSIALRDADETFADYVKSRYHNA